MDRSNHNNGLEDLNITVVGPDEHPSSSMPVPIIFKQNGGQALDAFNYTSTEPHQDYAGGSHDGSSSGGHSTPITPYSAFLTFENSEQHLSQASERPYVSFDDQLAPPGATFSPTSLSPSFNGLTLSDSNSPYTTDSTIMFNSTVIASKDPNATSYGPYSPLPDPSVYSNNSTLNSRTGLQVSIPAQPPADPLTEFADIFNFEPGVGGQDLLSPDSGLTTPFDLVLPMGQQQPHFSNDGTAQHQHDMHQRLGRPHNRGLSVSGTSWTPPSLQTPSSTLTSPSLSYTPTEYQGNSGLAPRSPYLSPDHNSNGQHDLDFSILPGEATVQRRHSHTGHGRSSSTSHRGRSISRSSGAPPSATSSRRSSPYPSPRPGCSPIESLDPAQIWSEATHLSVPVLEGVGGGLSRRHSFSPGTYRGQQQQQQFHQGQHQQQVHHDGTHSANGLLEFHVSSSPSPASHSPISSSPSGTSPIRQVASSAGIKASEARRTKEARFCCDICGQTFTTNHNLKNHKNVHFGVKEHQCGSCTRMFTTQSVLARHLKTCKAANAAGGGAAGAS